MVVDMVACALVKGHVRTAIHGTPFAHAPASHTAARTSGKARQRSKRLRSKQTWASSSGWRRMTATCRPHTTRAGGGSRLWSQPPRLLMARGCWRWCACWRSWTRQWVAWTSCGLWAVEGGHPWAVLHGLLQGRAGGLTHDGIAFAADAGCEATLRALVATVGFQEDKRTLCAHRYAAAAGNGTWAC